MSFPVANHAHSILLGVSYWCFWAVLLPGMGGYELDEKEDILKDGTTITRFTHRHRE